MAHKEQKRFFKWVRAHLSQVDKFTNVKVLDVGSLDINGNNRHLFFNPIYTGIDIIAGKNVDIVCPIHEYATDERYDVVISSEMLEHDCHYVDSLNKCYELLKSGGMMLISCAADGRPEHGTISTTPADSPATTEYYMNLSIEKFTSALQPSTKFSEYYIKQTTDFPQDLYFYGIKN